MIPKFSSTLEKPRILINNLKLKNMKELGTINHGKSIGTYNDDVHIHTIDQHSWVEVTSSGSIKIDEKINEHCNVYLSAKGKIEIKQSIDQHCRVSLHAEQGISIGQKINEHCRVEIFVDGSGDVLIGESVDNTSYARINVRTGNIHISQGANNGSTVQVYCSGNIVCGRGNNAEVIVDPNPLAVMKIYEENAN